MPTSTLESEDSGVCGELVQFEKRQHSNFCHLDGRGHVILGIAHDGRISFASYTIVFYGLPAGLSSMISEPAYPISAITHGSWRRTCLYLSSLLESGDSYRRGSYQSRVPVDTASVLSCSPPVRTRGANGAGGMVPREEWH